MQLAYTRDESVPVSVLAPQFGLLTKLKEMRYGKPKEARILCWPTVMRFYGSVVPSQTGGSEHIPSGLFCSLMVCSGIGGSEMIL